MKPRNSRSKAGGFVCGEQPEDGFIPGLEPSRCTRRARIYLAAYAAPEHVLCEVIPGIGDRARHATPFCSRRYRVPGAACGSRAGTVAVWLCAMS